MLLFISFCFSVDPKGVEYVFDLRCPHKKELQAVRSGERGGQEAVPPLFIQLFGIL